MKHTLLTRLDSKISLIASELDQVQALTLAGLSMSRLWTPFEKRALENKAPKLIEWGMACFNTLWDQINLEQLYGQEFDKYYRYLDKIDGKIERLVDEEIEVEGSIAYPLLEVFSSALCCFYDPKLLPGLQRSSFWSDITVIVGQGAEYIYDTIFSDAGNTNESELIILVEADSRWEAECQRIKDDVAFLKTHFKDKIAIGELKEKYMRMDIFA